ncbi:hypothetical protein RDWZM_007669 [Blomia tropicalis]|uniref:Voltage-gated hydrogen channel 1 n=1 Tax=Blomia tropicalis TaxID=40697 RepID=A0A9Q0M307_BLOTA|nr:hypothetical protein RDWZM_007669 [Blomia tropicalis]
MPPPPPPERQHSVRFTHGPPPTRRDHRLKRSRSQYMSTPHLTSGYSSSWQLNHLNPNTTSAMMKRSQSRQSVHINMNRANRASNRHIASAHKLIDGLNDEETSFKHKVHSIISSYNFQIIMVVLVLMDCIMVLGEMIIEMQLSINDCEDYDLGHGHGHGGGVEKVPDWNSTTTDGDQMQPMESVVDPMQIHIPWICHYAHLMHHLEEYFHLTSIFILFIFNIELLTHLYTSGYKHFCNWEMALDALIVVVSFWLDIAFLDSSLKRYLYLLIILRMWRVLRIFHAILTAVKAPYERQVEKLKKKRKILQRDLAKAYFYSNMLEDEIKNLRRYIEDIENERRMAEEDTEEEEEEDEEVVTDDASSCEKTLLEKPADDHDSELHTNNNNETK